MIKTNFLYWILLKINKSKEIIYLINVILCKVYYVSVSMVMLSVVCHIGYTVCGLEEHRSLTAETLTIKIS